MISATPGTIELAPTAAQPGAPGNAAGNAASLSDGAQNPLFGQLLGGLQKGENSTFPNSQSPSEPLNQGAESPADQAADGDGFPLLATLIDSARATQSTGNPALTGTPQSQSGVEKHGVAATTNTTASGNNLPLPGNALPVTARVAEQSIQGSMQSSQATDHAAALAKINLEADSDRGQGLQQRFARDLDPATSRETLGDQFETARKVNEHSLRERLHASSQFNQQFSQAIQSGSAGTNGSDAATSALLNTSSQSVSANQTASTPTMTPVLDSTADQQNMLDTKSTLGRTEPVVKEMLTTAYGNPRWHTEFAGKLRVLSQANVSTVELNLNPAELGAIDIKIHALDDGTIINFFSSNANTREVIDASLPRLRELLAESGIQLQHGDVSERNPQAQHSDASKQHDLAIDLADDLQALHPGVTTRRATESMIDHYV